MTTHNRLAQGNPTTTSRNTIPTSPSSSPRPPPPQQLQPSFVPSDPFSNTNNTDSDSLPTQPPPIVRRCPNNYPDYDDRAQYQYYYHPSHNLRQQTSQPYHYGTSVSSVGGSSASESIDLEKGACLRGAELRHDTSRTSMAPVDLGAEIMSEKSTGREKKEHFQPTVAGDRVAPFERWSMDAEEKRELESKAMKLLLFLSGPCALLSMAISFYTLFALLLTLLLSPLHLCFRRRPSPSTHLLSLLAPSLTLQLRCVCSPFVSATSSPLQYSLPMLLIVNAVGPLLSLGVALAAWVVGLYWVLAAMVGNPDGLDGRNDGRETVAGLRRWWEGWLIRAAVAGGEA